MNAIVCKVFPRPISSAMHTPHTFFPTEGGFCRAFPTYIETRNLSPSI